MALTTYLHGNTALLIHCELNIRARLIQLFELKKRKMVCHWLRLEVVLKIILIACSQQ
jgi:hypothetical protein